MLLLPRAMAASYSRVSTRGSFGLRRGLLLAQHERHLRLLAGRQVRVDDAPRGRLVQLRRCEVVLLLQLLHRAVRGGEEALEVRLDGALGRAVVQAAFLGLAEVLLRALRMRHRGSLQGYLPTFELKTRIIRLAELPTRAASERVRDAARLGGARGEHAPPSLGVA